jgi:hypothetical protein
VRPEGLGKFKKFIHLIGSRTRDIPACSVVPQPRGDKNLLHEPKIAPPPSIQQPAELSETNSKCCRSNVWKVANTNLVRATKYRCTGVVTTPSVSTHLQELVITSHLPIFLTTSEHPAVVSTLTATLLSALNWTRVTVTLAPSTEQISAFEQAASRVGICYLHHATIADTRSA